MARSRVQRRLGAGAVAIVVMTTMGVAAAPVVAEQTTPTVAANLRQADARAAAAAASLVASRPAGLHVGPDDGFVQLPVISSLGWRYVPYERTYRGLPVVGGDFVVVVDPAGRVSSTSVAQTYPIKGIGTTPGVTLTAAKTTAAGRLRSVSKVGNDRLVVYALGGAARLAWESTVEGVGSGGSSRLTVQVDALTGAVLGSREYVKADVGYGGYNGMVFIRSRPSEIDEGIRILKDPVIRSLSCGDFATRIPFDSTDLAWGWGDLADPESQCVDAMFAAKTQTIMLSQWLGRNGPDGLGGAWPMYVNVVGPDADKAVFRGDQIDFGIDTLHNRPTTPLDIVGHEMGHGIDSRTPGGFSQKGTGEFIADVFGTATEFYANRAAHDPPDYTLGEQLGGTQARRYMYNPFITRGSNCYHAGIEATTPPHNAAGVGNHWFYLVAEGTHPTNGHPRSPTCNSTTVTGVGLLKALQVLYHAMLMKTSDSSYRAYRSWTLAAARNLFPGDCVVYNTVKAAWDAVSVPVQAGEPTCLRNGPWLAAGRTADGRLDLYSHDQSTPTYVHPHLALNSTMWSAPQVIGAGAGNIKELAGEANADGRLELVGIDAATSRVVHRWQIGDGSWSNWIAFEHQDGPAAPGPFISVAAARRADGHLEVYAVEGDTGLVFQRFQTSAGGPEWSTWRQFGSTPPLPCDQTGCHPPQINSLAAGINLTGKIEVYATTTAGEVLRRRQDSIDSWFSWTYLTDSHWTSGHANRFTSLAVARTYDGRLELYGLNGDQVQTRTETAPGGPWGDWLPFGATPPGLVDLDAEVNADGRVSLFAVDWNGDLHQRAQGWPIWNWSPWSQIVPPPTSGPVPDVRELPTLTAIQVLQASGFVADVEPFVDHYCNHIRTVESQRPEAGTVAAIGTVVEIWVGAEPPTPCP